MPNAGKLGEKGVAALSTVLIILSVVVVLILSATYTSIGEGQSGLSLLQGEENLQQVEGCVEDAMLKVRSNPSFGDPVLTPVNITRPSPQPTCIVTVISKTGTNPVVWDMDITVDTTTVKRTISVGFSRSDTGITLISWDEI